MAMYDDSSRANFQACMRELLRDLNSAGEKPYKAKRASRTIAVDAAVLRYMINNMHASAFPTDCTGPQK